MTQEELDKLIKEENAKIENGTSNLTSPNGASSLTKFQEMGSLEEGKFLA